MDEPKDGAPPAPPSDAPPPEKPKARPAKAGEVDEAVLRAPVPSAALDRLKAGLPGVVEESSFHCGVPIVRVGAARIVEVLRFLKEDAGCQMTLLADLTGVDLLRLDRPDPRFDVVYHLFSLTTRERIAVKAAVAEGQEIDTVSTVFRTANWHEREAFDMFGIVFRGHPDLRRILMPEDFDAYPLRKDFPLEGREKDHGNWRRPEDDRRFGAS
jgi:NADH-quinone oxidoreductase subunit C